METLVLCTFPCSQVLDAQVIEWIKLSPKDWVAGVSKDGVSDPQDQVVL